MAPIDVLFVWEQLLLADGVSTFLLQCLEHLPAHGFQPHVLCLAARPTYTPAHLPQACQGQVRHVLPSRWDSPRRWRRKVQAAIRGIQPAIVVFNEHRHADEILPGLDPAAQAMGIMHSCRPDARYYDLAAALLACLARMVGVSAPTAKRLQHILPPDLRGRVAHIPYGIEIPPDPERGAAGPPAPLRLVYLGRVAQHEKRAFDFLPFVRELDRHGVAYRFTVVGDGPDGPAVRAQLADHVAAGRVVFHGAQPHAAALRLLAEQDVLLLFSEFEGLPISMLEGMARGVVPVVPRLAGGISEVIRDKANGRLYPTGEPAQAAALVHELARQPETCLALGRAARATALEFSREKCMAAYAGLFRELLRAPPRPAWPAPRESLRARILARVPIGLRPAGPR